MTELNEGNTTAEWKSADSCKEALSCVQIRQAPSAKAVKAEAGRKEV